MFSFIAAIGKVLAVLALIAGLAAAGRILGWQNIRKYGKRIALVLVVLIVGVNSFYTVSEQEQAVVTTFGKRTSTQDVGPHFKIPFIQKVEKVPVNMVQKMTIGYYYDEDDNLQIVEDENRIMTGDDNIVAIDFFAEWQISDPVKYLYNSNNASGILKALTQACARNIVGSEEVDNVMTTGKEAIQTAIEDKVRENLEEYDIGIQIRDIKIQDVDPPTDSVSAAFKAVEDAKQKKEELVNKANADKEEALGKAQSEADKIYKEALAYYQARIQMAEGEADRFTEMYNQYANYPAITRTRMYLEVVEDLFPDMEIYINTTEGGTTTLIPIQDIANAVNSKEAK